MIRFIILALVIWLIWFFVKQKLQRGVKKQQTKVVKNMVSCSNCGLHLPQNEAIFYQGKYFCSKKHIL